MNPAPVNAVPLSVVPPVPHDILVRHDGGRVADAAVIVPVWNGASFLPACCDAVRAQQGAGIELIIVDDGSVDGSAELAVDLVTRDLDRLARALVVRHTIRSGPAAARDTGMRLSSAPAALLLDVDNVIYPRCVRRCLDGLEASSAAFVYPILRRMGSSGGLVGYQHFDRERLARGNYIDMLAMVRRSAWEEVGGFPHLADGLEDYAFWLTLTERGYTGAQIPEILAAYRVHAAGRNHAAAAKLPALYDRLELAFPWTRLTRPPPPAPPPVAPALPAALVPASVAPAVQGLSGPGALPHRPDLYIDLMIRILTNSIYQDPSMHPDLPAAFDPLRRAHGQDWPEHAHSMAGAARLRNLADLVARTLAEDIPGDYIETGVWRGGCCILMRAVLAAHGVRGRRVFVADSFEGLPPPKPDLYPQDGDDRHHEWPQLAVPLQEVQANFARYGLLDEQVVFVPGFFDETLPALDAGPFALLRLDGDMYESTRIALDALYPKLSPGGFVIIDDYGAVEGCRQAVDDFRAAHGITAPLEVIDWAGIWWRKPLDAARDPHPAAPPARAGTPPEASGRAAHLALFRDFARGCAERGLTPDPLLFWYHAVDLGGGLVTPGSFDYRAVVEAFGLPAGMHGMSALDVGSATGFFAFEMERRGASVTSVELPALSRWDTFPGETSSAIIAKIRERLPSHSPLADGAMDEAFRSMSEAQLHGILLDGPFQFCRRALGSTVERVYTSIYDLGPTFGERRFDLVMLGDILVHVVDPLRALAAAAGVCRGEIVIADDIIGNEDDPPALRFVGGATEEGDAAEWWRANIAWYRQVLTRMGFREIALGPPFTVTVRPSGGRLNKRVLRARR